MNWNEIGGRIRQQRESIGLSREQFAEKIDITPKFCSDIELGIKGMSVSTLCKIAKTLHLSTDYILFGSEKNSLDSSLIALLENCSETERYYAEQIMLAFLSAMDAKK